MSILYTLAIFVSAALLFALQPMFTRMILPLLGGSPAVWNTAQVFFQAVLLAGYAYAHATTSRLGARRQAGWHLVLLILPLLVLPLAVPAGWTPPVAGSPVPWLLGLLAVAVGLPFFALSATGPLLQKWFASSARPRAGDPYFLYAASNAGSLLALLSYPLWLEPRFTLGAQAAYWTGGYLVFVVLMAGCAFALWRSNPAVTKVSGASTAVAPEEAPTFRRRLSWLGYSFVPSSLLLSVTTYVSSEVAVVPLLWVMPLSLYLLTFVLVFSGRARVPGAWLARAIALLLATVAMCLATQATELIALLAGIHLAAFFLVALSCHSRLSALRPGTAQLTSFYLWMSAGGVLGGVFNALVAPVIFDSVAEYPLMLVVAGFAALPAADGAERRARVADILWPAVLGAGLVALVFGFIYSKSDEMATAGSVIFGLGMLMCYLFSKQRTRFALGLVALLLAGIVWRSQGGHLLRAERSFFGVHRVNVDPTGEFHLLSHGRTLHGRQHLGAVGSREPLTYYHRTGPVADVLANHAAKVTDRVAVVGLGAGTLATYALPGQAWTLYEIDPEVVALASDPRYFTYLRDSAGKLDIVLGDARLSLVKASDGAYDVLVLDAYSSDAIPVHLVTREALALYLKKLAPGGVLAFHISNLHLDLEPVFASLAADAGLVCLIKDDTYVPAELLAAGKSPSIWIAMARTPQDTRALAREPGWLPVAKSKSPVWTDDYSSLLSAFRWR